MVPKRESMVESSYSVLVRSLKHPGSCVSRAERWEERFSSSRYRDETQEKSFTSQRLSRVRDFADESKLSGEQHKQFHPSGC